MESKKENTMDVTELKQWLFGEDARFVNWRTDPANVRKIAEMVDQLASKRDGLSAHESRKKLRAEQRQLERQREQEERAKARQERLRMIARRYFTGNGMAPAEFDRNWSKIREQLWMTGKADELLADDERQRRAHAARTF